MNKVLLPLALLLITFTFLNENGICGSTTRTEQVAQQQPAAKETGAEKKFPYGYPEKKPDTIKKAVDIILEVLTDNQKQLLKNTKKEDLIKYHMSIGMWIRNNFGLWGDNKKLLDELGGRHPDDASFILIEKSWEKLNE